MTTTRITPAMPVPEALPELEALVRGPRLNARERLALEVLIADAVDRYGLDRPCPSCGATPGRPCRTSGGDVLRDGGTHAPRRTLDLLDRSGAA